MILSALKEFLCPRMRSLAREIFRKLPTPNKNNQFFLKKLAYGVHNYYEKKTHKILLQPLCQI